MVLEKILPQKKSVQNVEHLQADVTKLDFPKATSVLRLSAQFPFNADLHFDFLHGAIYILLAQKRD